MSVATKTTTGNANFKTIQNAIDILEDFDKGIVKEQMECIQDALNDIKNDFDDIKQELKDAEDEIEEFEEKELDGTPVSDLMDSVIFADDNLAFISKSLPEYYAMEAFAKLCYKHKNLNRVAELINSLAA